MVFGWRQLRPSGVPPTPRCSHTTSFVDGALYVIGGGRATPFNGGGWEGASTTTSFEHCGDVQKLDLSKMHWSCAVASGAAFTPRRGHSAAVQEATGRIVCFSGTNGRERHTPDDNGLTDVQVLHVRRPGCTSREDSREDGGWEPRWEQIADAGRRPSARRGHHAVMLADAAMLVTGGYPLASFSPEDLTISLHVLELATWTWVGLDSSGQPPHGLALFGCALVAPRTEDDGCDEPLPTSSAARLQRAPRTQLICFGGHEYARAEETGPTCSTMWTLDLADATTAAGAGAAASAPSCDWSTVRCEWARLDAADATVPGEEPSARFCHALLELDAPPPNGHGRLFVFGGANDSGDPLSDAHLIDAAVNINHGRDSRYQKVSQHLLTADPVAWQSLAQPLRIDAEFGAPCARNAMTITRAADSCYVLFGGGVFPDAYYNDCWLFGPTTARFQPSDSPAFQEVSAHVPTSLIPHLSSLVGSPRFADVLIELADGSPPVPAHRLVLCSGASRYFSAALEGGFREATEAAHGEQVRMRLPVQITQATLMRLLRWMYVGELSIDEPSPPLSSSSPSQDDAAPTADVAGDCDGGGGDDGGAATWTRLLEVLVAVDALEMDGLQHECERQIASGLDLEDALEVISLAEDLHCERLRAHCLELLRSRFGVWERQRLRGTGRRWRELFAGAATDGSAEVRKALLDDLGDSLTFASEVVGHVRQMRGFGRMSERAMRDVEEFLGFEPGTLACAGQ